MEQLVLPVALPRYHPPGTGEYEIAIHEAGHAVAALVVGMPLIMATILPGENGTLGHIETHSGGPYWQPGDGKDCLRELVEAECIMTLAGGMAERLFLPRSDRRGCWEDYERVRLLLWYCDLHRPTLVRHTERLVRLHAEVIKSVAGALIIHRWLSGDDVEALCPGITLRRRDPASRRAAMDRHWPSGGSTRRDWEEAMREDDGGGDGDDDDKPNIADPLAEKYI
jgi:hypothetical protein